MLLSFTLDSPVCAVFPYLHHYTTQFFLFRTKFCDASILYFRFSSMCSLSLFASFHYSIFFTLFSPALSCFIPQFRLLAPRLREPLCPLYPFCHFWRFCHFWHFYCPS